MSRDGWPSGDSGRPGDEPLVRPFLRDRSPGPGEGAPPPGAWRHETGPPATDPRTDLRAEVRPYVMTGGRTGAPQARIAMETVVVSDPSRPGGPRAFEHAAVLAECSRPRSVAEIAARLRLPLVVAVVVVGDLVAEGLLEASSAGARQADDIPFLERLIDGVSAL